MRAGDWTLPHGGLSGLHLETAKDFRDFAPHPDSLVLFFSESLQECSQPVRHPSTESADLGADTHDFWQLIFIIPPELNRPGLIDLRDQRIPIDEFVWKPPVDSLISSGHGSRGLPWKRKQTLEIVSSDESSVSVKLDWGDPFPGWGQTDRDYTATFAAPRPP